MLMAAALLISTNAGAQGTVATVTGDGAGSYISLQAAVNAIPAGGTATITLEDNISLDAPVVIPQVGTSKDDVVSDADKVVNRALQHITLNLNGYNIDAAEGYLGSAFILFKGELNITGEGSISRSDATGTWYKSTWGNFAKATIVVCGADGNKTTPANDRSKQEWSILNIGKKVTIYGMGNNDEVAGKKEGGFGICIQNFKSESFPADLDASVHKANLGYQTIYGTTHPMWWDNNANAGAAFGVKVIVAGTVDAYQRGINILGTINQSAKEVEGATARKYDAYPYYDHNYPYIKIEKGATVSCIKDGLESGNGGIYAGGWAVIDILGTVKGQTGVFLKASDLVINGGTVQSTSTTGATTSADYGKNVSGNAIFIGSASNYAGSTTVNVEGGATVATNAPGGAAIVDKVAENTVTTSTATVEHVTITEGNLDGGIAVTTATSGKTTIINATIEDGITINGNPATPEQVATIMVPGTTNYTQGAEEPNTIVNLVPNSTTITVLPNTAKNVTLNADGYATYSFENSTVGACRQLPDGVTAYVATGDLDNGYLALNPINGNIPAGVGVILAGNPNQVCELSLQTSGAADNITASNNKLLAASAWTTEPAVTGIYTATTAEMQAKASLTPYVLVGNELYKYTGKQMKVNKAYLQLPAQTNAPKRIQMIFNETQGVDNVETTIEAVKFMKNGQIYIRRGENIYNVQGQIVK